MNRKSGSAGAYADGTLSLAEIASLRGPYVTRPAETVSEFEWLRWAREILAAQNDAEILVRAALNAQAAANL